MGRDMSRFWHLHTNRDSTKRASAPMFDKFMTEIGMTIVVLGVVATIAYLAWVSQTDGQAQKRRVPIRVRDEDPRRRRR